MRKNIYFISILIGIVALISLFAVFKSNDFTITYLAYENISRTIKDKGFVIIYNDDLTPEAKEVLKNFNDEYLATCYYSDLSLDEIKTMVGDKEIVVESEDVFILFVEGEILDVISFDTEYERFIELIEKYLFNKIPESERYYQVLSTADEYIKKVNSKNYTIAVFGKNDCTYCDLYLPVVNDIAKNYNLNIYYFDQDTYNEEEYEKIIELDFEIPSKCTTTGFPTSLSQSFPKPMTIITKSGKFVDCIRGYVPEQTVLDMLKEYKIIKEK